MNPLAEFLVLPTAWGDDPWSYYFAFFGGVGIPWVRMWRPAQNDIFLEKLQLFGQFLLILPLFSSGTIRNPFSRKINKLSVSIFFFCQKFFEVWGVALLILLTAVLFGLLISAKRVQTRRRLQWLQKQRTTGHRYVGPKSQFESSSKRCLEQLFGVDFYKMTLSFCLNNI